MFLQFRLYLHFSLFLRDICDFGDFGDFGDLREILESHFSVCFYGVFSRCLFYHVNLQYFLAFVF